MIFFPLPFVFNFCEIFLILVVVTN